MTDTDLWLRRFHPAEEAGGRLLCLPHAGGSASYFFAVSRALSPEVDVLAVQYPGRQDRRREPCVDSVPELADRLVAAILGADTPVADRPITIFGHSLGATLGFEVARRLEAEGVTPTALFASGRRAPHRHRVERTHLLDDAGLLADVRALAGTDSALLADDDVLAMVLPAIRGDYRAAECYEYRPGPPLRCPIHALVGDRDPKVTVAEAAAWREHTDGEFELGVYPGGHFFLDNHVPDILRRIRTHIRMRTNAAACTERK
ncbi:MAG TPA: alpha/beta fold hydrolase [Actinophytocola sp.]|nr:alpha/beta fold hydrolase [Actinophytocola sp.]